jgi:hypothetical protein
MTALSNVANFRIDDLKTILWPTNFELIDPFIGVENKSEEIDTAISIRPIDSLTIENYKIINSIKSFELLNENWDKEGARPIPTETINQSTKIVKHLDLSNINIYFASPGPNQEILLLVKNNTKELEIIIYPNKQKFVKFSNNEFIDQGDLEVEKIPELVEWTQNNE